MPAGWLARARTVFCDRSLLLSEDEKTVAEALGEALAPAFARVESAADGMETLACLIKRDYDIILLDVKMPKMGGIEVYKYLRLFKPHLAGRVIFITGELHDPDVREFIESTGAICIEKPFSFKALLKPMEAILAPASERPHTPR